MLLLLLPTAPWFFLRLWRFTNHLLTYLLPYTVRGFSRCIRNLLVTIATDNKRCSKQRRHYDAAFSRQAENARRKHRKTSRLRNICLPQHLERRINKAGHGLLSLQCACENGVQWNGGIAVGCIRLSPAWVKRSTYYCCCCCCCWWWWWWRLRWKRTNRPSRGYDVGAAGPRF